MISFIAEESKYFHWETMSQKVDLAKWPPTDEGNEYDLKASTKEICQLYPVLKAADGELIDGLEV